jgi:hypothetical protein
MKRKKAFLLYHDSYETIRFLDDEQLGKLTRLIFEYKLYGTFPDPSNMLFFVFNPIKLQLDRDNESYLESIEAKSKAGKKSAEIKALKQIQQSSTESTRVESVDVCSTESTDNDNVNDNVSVSVNEREIVKVKNNKEPKSISDFVKLMDSEKYLGTDENLNKTFINFIQMRINIKKIPTKNAVELLVKKLKELSKANKDVAIKILENSIENNWSTIYELKTSNTTNFIKQAPAVFNRSSQGQKYVGDDVI